MKAVLTVRIQPQDEALIEGICSALTKVGGGGPWSAFTPRWAELENALVDTQEISRDTIDLLHEVMYSACEYDVHQACHDLSTSNAFQKDTAHKIIALVSECNELNRRYNAAILAYNLGKREEAM